MNQDFRVYTVEDVADILKVCANTIKNYIREGKIKKINNIGSVRITHTELEKFLNGDENEVV